MTYTHTRSTTRTLLAMSIMMAFNPTFAASPSFAAAGRTCYDYVADVRMNPPPVYAPLTLTGKAVTLNRAIYPSLDTCKQDWQVNCEPIATSDHLNRYAGPFYTKNGLVFKMNGQSEKRETIQLHTDKIITQTHDISAVHHPGLGIYRNSPKAQALMRVSGLGLPPPLPQCDRDPVPFIYIC